MRKTAIKTLFDSIFVIHLPPLFFFFFGEGCYPLKKSLLFCCFPPRFALMRYRRKDERRLKIA